MFKCGQASLCQVRTKLGLASCSKSSVCDENYSSQYIRGYIKSRADGLSETEGPDFRKLS